uniref:Uncharacterized protein n=1 Tax=Onchocerca volvulus TaxID=6282 RepID=A0A8R1TSF5_ONCVO
MGGIENGCFGRMGKNRLIIPTNHCFPDSSADTEFPSSMNHSQNHASSVLILFPDNNHHSKKHAAIFSVQDNKVLQEGMLRFAHSAPCSPKNVLSRPEFRSCGATFRVRQSAKDGRSRLQLCPSAPEYRSVSINKALGSDALHPVTSYSRNGTKSLSTTPVRELLQGSTGLKLEDLRPDLILLSNSNEPQHHQASGKEAQPHHSNKHQSPTHLARVEKPFVSEKMIVASSAKAYSYTRPEQQHTSSFKTSGMQQVIGIKNYGGDAEIVVENEVTQENGSFKQLPIMRKYGVDESVKLSASEIKRLSGECFQEDMLIQRKRTYTEAIADIGIQKEHKITKKSKKVDKISAPRAEKVMEKKQDEVDVQLALGAAQINNRGAIGIGNPLLTSPPSARSETTISTNSDFLAQQFQIADNMNQNQVYPNTAEAESVLDKLELATAVYSAQLEWLRNKVSEEMPSQHQSDFVTNLNSQPQTSTATTAQLADSWHVAAMASSEFAAICQRLLEKPDMLSTSQPAQPENAPVTGAASQNMPSYNSLLSDVALVTAVSQLEATAHMQYQSKIQQISASVESLGHLSSYVNYIKTLAGVLVSQSQPQSSASVAPTNAEQQQHHQNHSPEELQPQAQPQFTFPNYSFPTTFPPNNPFLDHDLNLNIGQWFNYMRLLAIQSNSARLHMPPATTPLWNPLSMTDPQNACTLLSIFPDSQQQLSDLIQPNYDNINGNHGIQHPNDLQAAEILAAISSISKLPSAQ